MRQSARVPLVCLVSGTGVFLRHLFLGKKAQLISNDALVDAVVAWVHAFPFALHRVLLWLLTELQCAPDADLCASSPSFTFTLINSSF